MYKVAKLPSPRADINELADFVEIECLRNEQVSRREIISVLGRLEENDYTDGNPIDDPLENKLDDVFSEIGFRRKICKEAYPFYLDCSGHVLKIDSNINTTFYYLYTYLLLSTRLNMKTDKVQNGIDGTLLFEEVSGEIAKEYLGSRAESFLFGTSSTGSRFEEKINDLCKELNEGNGFRNRNDVDPSYIKDDSLDVVAWKPFSDNYPGKVIAFGQCKTGTSWYNGFPSLQSDKFCQKWFNDQPSVTPVRFFFLAESILRTKWYTAATDAGVLFDRCRIMDYSQNLSDGLFQKIKSWTDSALKNNGLNQLTINGK